MTAEVISHICQLAYLSAQRTYGDKEAHHGQDARDGGDKNGSLTRGHDPFSLEAPVPRLEQLPVGAPGPTYVDAKPDYVDAKPTIGRFNANPPVEP